MSNVPEIFAAMLATMTFLEDHPNAWIDDGEVWTAIAPYCGADSVARQNFDTMMRTLVNRDAVKKRGESYQINPDWIRTA